MYSAEPLPHFVDEYLSYLYEAHPTNATFDGVHLHDDLLEDLSRQAHRGAGARSRRLRQAPGGDRSRPTDRYRAARAAGPGLEYPGPRVRARGGPHVGTKPPALRGHPGDEPCRTGAVRLRAAGGTGPAGPVEAAPGAACSIQAARDNIKDRPGIFVKVGLESMRGTLRFIDDDLPRAFGDLSDLHLLGDLADASTEAAASIGGYIEYLGARPRAAEQGVVSSRPRQVRAEAAGWTRASRSAPTGCSRSRRASCRRRRRSSAAWPRG